MLNLDSANELDNDIVTVTKIQIALKAAARSLQSNLSQLVMEADLQSDLGLWQLLQSSLENLLNNYPDWTHFLGSSQTLNDRDNAQELFETYSLAARQKFSAETLSNLQGNFTQTAPMIDDLEPGEADYIVVTLLIGTAHDRPLFASINSAAELKAALQTVAAMPPEYLLIFELLWSPQLPTDSLSASQFAQDYPDLIAI
jgi:uncharacterized membrane protein